MKKTLIKTLETEPDYQELFSANQEFKEILSQTFIQCVRRNKLHEKQQ